MGAEDDRSTAQSHSSAEPDLAAGAAPCAPEDEKPEPQAWMLSQPVLRDCNYGGAFCELLVVEAIQEYLSFHNLQDSLGALRRSLGKTGLREMFGCASESVPDVKGQSEDKGVQPCVPRGQMELSVVNALREFDEGQRDNFFQLWSGLVPPDSIGGPTGCSLELRLRVYFGIYESRKAAPDVYDESCTFWPEPDFTDLKAFLASKPSAAESAQSLSPLYALPFVPRPQENAALRFIFEDAWSQKLRTDVQAFLTAYASMRHAPSLRHLVGALIAAKCPKQSPPPASWHEMLRIANFGLTTANHAVQRLGKAPGHGAEQASHAKELQEWLCTGGTALPELQKQACDARRLFGSLARRPEAPPVQEPARPVGRPSIASLARALSSDLEPQGGSSPGQGVMVSQERLWPMSREALRGSSASSLNASNSNANVRRLHSARSIESRARTATALLPVPPALDFGRIASLVAEEVTEDLPSILSVLRAVLRRLALPDEPIRPRRAFLAAFACFGALRTLAMKLHEMVTGDPLHLEMSLAVMAVCACEVVGRREIEAAEAQAGCISALISVANSSVRSLAHMHCLAVLQRLSLRGHLQSKMIRLGALDVVLKLLESVRKEEGPGTSDWCRLGPGDGPDTPDFSIEFTSALLMNLTLRSAGRRRCAELGAYSVLVGLIEHPNPQVRTHINGTLYTLLGVKAIRGEAQRQGAEAVFQSALERVTPENELLQRQLEFLQHQLHRSDGDSDEESEEGDPSPEGDADDGDNFLDEEELAAHFHLASVAAVGQGDGFSPAEIEANAKAAAAEAAAAEEALRCFRATPAVADAQQRRFHAFIARSCRNLMSPKRRGHSFDRMSPLSPPMLSPSSSPEPGQPAKVAEPPVTVTISPEMHEAPGLVPEAPSDKSPDPLGSLSPSTGSQPQSTSSKLEVSPQRGSAKMTEGVLMKAAEQANRSERGQRPPRQPSVDEKSPNRRPASRPNGDSEEGVGRGKGRGRGRGSNTVTKSASLPPLPESKAGSMRHFPSLLRLGLCAKVAGGQQPQRCQLLWVARKEASVDPGRHQAKGRGQWM
ncbi:unnamed protein product [Effrenium voratum]|uniref:LisH domain-containing protein ARMC9 n=1 Tax=Effrenium voratum TaxID=2562239 RepID=A0AA36HS75_9DINO|nr:unnamed protein product [Effrenium voratum]